MQDNRANGKKSFPSHVPGPKKRTKMVPKSGPFQKEPKISLASSRGLKDLIGMVVLVVEKIVVEVVVFWWMWLFVCCWLL